MSGGGTGATARTFFDSSFGGNGIRRLLICNGTTVLVTAAAQVPEFSLALVVVNSTIYGGSGGSVGTYSLAGGATEIAIHEIGHTAFGLADEYPYYAGGAETGHDNHPATEPAEPNVTINTNRATLKWGWAVAATTTLPTMSNPSCSTVDSLPSSVPTGTVGLFEGAHYYHCGAFRPEYDCKMRALSVPFCAICRQVMRNRIGPLMVAPPAVGDRWPTRSRTRVATWPSSTTCSGPRTATSMRCGSASRPAGTTRTAASDRRPNTTSHEVLPDPNYPSLGDVRPRWRLVEGAGRRGDPTSCTQAPRSRRRMTRA